MRARVLSRLTKAPLALVVFFLGVLLLCILCAFLFFSHDTVVVTRTSHGFVPQKITLQKGDSIRFVSDAGVPFWPASDSHPSHGIYPAFDPKEPIAPEESWTFTFTKPGVWKFHDHLGSSFTGVVVVQGAPGEAREACLSHASDVALTPECWEADVVEILTKNGLEEAFAYIDELHQSDPRFRRNCHDVMHVLGAAAYRKFESDHMVIDLPQTAYCGYGFYHGFIETMLIENGSANYEEVVGYCTELQNKNHGGGQCFHGIGHAVFDSLPGETWGSREGMVAAGLSVCEGILGGDAERTQCGSGIFNSMANAMSSRVYGLSFDAFNPATFCSAYGPLYENVCLGEAGIGFVRQQGLVRADALAFIDSLGRETREHMYFVYFADETKRAFATAPFPMQEFHDACSAIPSYVFRQQCIRGVIQGFREETPVGLYQYSFPFCETFAAGSNERSYCGTQIHAITIGSERESPEFQRACQAFLHTTEENCMR